MNSISEHTNAPQDGQKFELPIAQDEEAFTVYMEALRAEIAANWTNGYCQMPDAVRQDRSLSPKAKIIYEQLLHYMWFKSDRCWPSQQTLADATGYSRRTVIRACKELYERGYIEKWRRGQGYTNYYFINPLTFPRSFKRTGREEPATMVLPTSAPELRQDMSSAAPRSIDAVLAGLCQVDTSRSDRPAQQEAPEWHTKHTKEKEIQEKNRYSNDSTSEKGTGIAAAAIRNEQLNSKANGEGANINQPSVSTPSKPNHQPNGTEQTAAVRAKAVKEAQAAQQGQPSAQAAAIAQATGIPAEHLAEMGIAQEPERRPVPDFIVSVVGDFTRELGDSPRSAKSNITRAAKLYYFALDYIREAQEDPEGFYLDLLYQAKAAARRVNNIKHRNGNKFNRIPVFFTCLENLFELTDAERAYVRSDLPLLHPEDRSA